MFRKFKGKGKGKKTQATPSSSAPALIDEFQKLKEKTNTDFIPFFKKLYEDSDLKPYWDKIYAELKKMQGEEGLGFFEAYLQFMSQPATKKTWQELYVWIGMDPGDTRHDKINIIGTTRADLRQVNADIMAGGDSVNLDSIKSILDTTANEVLRLTSSDLGPSIMIQDTLSKSLEDIMKELKKDEKEAKKKEKRYR